ncbi:MAG: TetR/AcrR family transcriptional regulator [Propionibacteriaceae bacterium]
MDSFPESGTPARILHAALELFAVNGFGNTTIRDIAAAAAVSPGLVIHHFGSREKLHQAVDDWVMEFLDDPRHIDLLSGDMTTIMSFVKENPDIELIIGYLKQTFRAAKAQSSTLFDRMASITANAAAQGEAADYLRPSTDTPARNAIMVCYSLGVLLFADDLARHLDDVSILEPTVYSRYLAVSLDLLNQGILTAPQPLRTTYDRSNRDK